MKPSSAILAAALAVACGSSNKSAPIAEQPASTLRGVNLAGAEFGETNLPGVFGNDYTYPTHAEVDYFISKKMNLIRLPFRWERLQPTLGAAFDPAEQGRLDDLVDYITQQGASVLIDPHNYARYYEQIIGQGPTVQDFAEFWSQLAAHFADNPKVVFGLMNEPHDIPVVDWLAAANAALLEIRNAGANNLVLVPGINWSNASAWYQDWGFGTNSKVMTGLVDPANHFMFEVHLYMDSDGSGTSPDCVSATAGSDVIWAFTDWLNAHGQRAILGEFGAAANATCLSALDDLLNYTDAHQDAWAGWTYWAAGPWWPADNAYSVEPDGALDKAQMAVLSRHLH
jgi:endoglucanase